MDSIEDIVDNLRIARQEASARLAEKLALQQTQQQRYFERCVEYTSNAKVRVMHALSLLSGAELISAQTAVVIPSYYDFRITQDSAPYRRLTPSGDSATRFIVPNHFELPEVREAIHTWLLEKSALDVDIQDIDELSPYEGHARLTIRW